MSNSKRKGEPKVKSPTQKLRKLESRKNPTKTSIANHEKWLYALSRLITDDDLKIGNLGADDISDDVRKSRGVQRQDALISLEGLLGTDITMLILSYAPERDEIHAHFGGPLLGRILQIRLQVENSTDQFITNETEYAAAVGNKDKLWLSAASLDNQDETWGELDMDVLRTALDAVIVGHVDDSSDDKTVELSTMIDEGNASVDRFVRLHRDMATFKELDENYLGPKETSLHDHILLSAPDNGKVFRVHKGCPLVTLNPAHLYINPECLGADDKRIYGPEDAYKSVGMTELPIFKRGSLADIIQEIRSKVPRGSLWHKLMVLADSSTRIQLNYLSPTK